MSDAAAILQAYLDGVSTLTLAQDWAGYRQMVALPCAVVSHDESKIITTEAELRQGFDDFAQSLRALRVTDFIRLVANAQSLDADLISGSYTTHLISGGQRILAPYTSLMTLRQIEGRWRAASITNGLANSRWPLLRPLNPED